MDLSIFIPTAQGALQSKIFTALSKSGYNINNSTMRAISSRVSEEAAYYIANLVKLSGNQQLTDIPKNAIGINNPVNITTANNSATSVSNNIWSILDTQLNSTVTGKVAVLLEKEMKRVLPKNTGIINYSGLAATIIQSLTPTVSSTIKSATTVFLTSVFGSGLKIPAVLGGGGISKAVNNLFGGSVTMDTSGPAGAVTTAFGENNSTGNGYLRDLQQYSVFKQMDAAMDRVNTQYVSQQTGKALQTSQNFNVDNADNKEKLTAVSQGFIDPNAKYPTKEYAGKSETNLLAQGDPRGTIVHTKEKERMKGARLPFDHSWDQPETPYKAEYPYNKVTQTESGHIIEIDDTPGNERLHVYHKSGTFIEIDSNGSMVKKTKGSSYEIIDRNGKISIAGRADVSINGACNIYVGNDANIEVEGDVNLRCHNDITAEAGGTLNLSATEEVNITSTQINIQAYENINVSANANFSMYVSDTLNMKANTEMRLQSTDIFEKYTTKHSQGTDQHNKLEGSLYLNTGGEINQLAGGAVNIDGSAANINSGNAVEAEVSKDASEAGASHIGILSGRKDVVYFELEDPTSLTLADGVSINTESSTTDDTRNSKEQQRSEILATGTCTPEDYDATPVAKDTASPTSLQTARVAPTESIKGATFLPGNYNLSPNFTLEMVTTQAALSHYELTYNRDTSYGEIAYNLQATALNILEPIYKLYPNMVVVSGFRPDTNPKSTSQHGIGQAVDIQFKGAARADYYDISKKLAEVLNYDQIILEYRSTSNNPWLHISYSVQENRKEVITVWNDQPYSSGLAMLE